MEFIGNSKSLFEKKGTFKSDDKSKNSMQKGGWVLKKATSSYMGMANWQKRYLVLNKDKLFFFDSEESAQGEAKAKKMVDMGNVKCVCLHYDHNAPIKSKKLQKGEKNDLSRFDVYTPGRVFNLKSEHEDTENTDDWVEVLRKSAAHHNPKYDTKFL